MGEWATVGDTGHQAYLARPADSSGPGVLVLHAWWGLTPVFTQICDELAARGYVALAPSLFADGATANTIPDAEALRDAQDEEAVVRPVLLASAALLRSLPEVSPTPLAVIGFSLGAYWAFHLSQVRPADVGAVVVFYGAGEGDFRETRAAYLGHFAEQDPYGTWTTCGIWSSKSATPAARSPSTSTRRRSTGSWSPIARSTTQTRRRWPGSGPGSSWLRQ